MWKCLSKLVAVSTFSALAFHSSAQATNNSKRGIAYLGTSHSSDYDIFVSGQSPIDWYYNWSPYPVGQPQGFASLEFVPLLHNLESLSGDLKQLGSLPESSSRLLTFNEPDHSTDGGGTDIAPEDAARAYHDQIVPLSVVNGGRWLISHPSTTGTLSGLNWLRNFNESCYAINKTHGCHIDFVATHFYGDFPALASWLSTLNDYYNTNQSANYSIWVTELALPQQSSSATLTMMNDTLPYLDGLDYVARYAWFGIFRQKSANEWTGDGVALLDNHGDLTKLGATYLGPPFKEGSSASDGSAEGAATMLQVRSRPVLMLSMLVLAIIWLA